MLRTAGAAARAELEEALQCKVYLELFVKVQQDWRDSEKALKQLGYTQE